MGKVKHNELPERWLDYKAVGSQIPGTRLAACKVPLREAMLRRVPPAERFGCKDLLNAFPKMGLLVDLTNTTRYYDPEVIKKENIKYVKIGCPGHVIPPPSIVKQFHELVTEFLQTEKDSDSIIVVHCTHGVNRTGYFVCSYMIQQMDYQPEEAMKLFNVARGHDMERANYTADLRSGCNGGNDRHLDKEYANRCYRKKSMNEKKRVREPMGGESRTRDFSESQRSMTDRFDRQPSRRNEETPGQWRRDQDDFRQQQQQLPSPRFQRFQPAPMGVGQPRPTFLDRPYRPPPPRFEGSSQDFRPSREDDSFASSGEVRSRFSWTPPGHNPPPPPTPWARNPNVRAYSPGVPPAPYPGFFQRGEGPPRVRGYRGSRGYTRNNP